MRKFGLIIQGPLLSVGEKTGRTSHVARGNLHEVFSHDCKSTIRALVRDFGHLFEHIVVSTWESEADPEDSWQGACLVASDDGKLPKKERKGKGGQKVPDNRFRQMFSTLAGLEHLENHSDVDIAVKVRTDQYLDLGRMLESMKSYEAAGRYTSDVLFVPNIMAETHRYGIGDYYFAGSPEAMKSFAESLFAYEGFEFEPSMHRGLWLKYAYTKEKYRNAIGAPLYAYFPVRHQEAYCAETLQICRFMMHHVFWPLSFGVYRTMVWRGEPVEGQALEHAQENSIFQERFLTNPVKELLHGTRPRFLSINWPRYASFRTAVLRQPFSFKERLFLFANRGGQSAVRLVQPAGTYIRRPQDISQLVRRKIRRVARLFTK